ncbi:phage Gp37/Gp68 family protein [Sphingomonas sp. Leaf343]|uniref:phage Gp37/Gp68 family protein n=1 Tax=Sphingomonas sp. Leaf343 TaxID=1736345 RepID=UPI0006FD9EED|nr:phage Gp37/Gp68 family protein [Sphingomonas sp. Leaf343]KQR83487.1 hypothetical protein ASG07_07100 [Sphingomonas sp. Leaf343]
MAENSAIEWTDHTFNPWEGCQKVGPGCDNCYAETRNARFGGGTAPNWGPGAPRRLTSKSNWQKPLQWQAAAEAFAAEHGRRQRVFCASLADVFDNAVPEIWRSTLFGLIDRTPHLDWLLLTKRIGNVAGMTDVEWGTEDWPTNVWLGATIVNQEEADRDLPKLLAIEGPKVRFLSMEPLLGPVSFDPCELASIDWIIVGGESGPGARPMHPDWARDLRDQCSIAFVPMLFKQWGEWLPWQPDQLPYFKSQHGELIDRHALPDFDSADLKGWTDSCLYDGHDLCVHQRVGKKVAGRELDGITHDGAPT